MLNILTDVPYFSGLDAECNLKSYSTNKLSINGYDFAAPDTKKHENTTLEM